MLTMYPNFVASFLTDGGRITKLTATVAVTVRELLDYLHTCGIAAKYADENFNGYLCDGKRVNLRCAPPPSEPSPLFTQAAASDYEAFALVDGSWHLQRALI